MNQDNAQRGRLQFTTGDDVHIVSLTNVVDVDGYTGICTYPMLLHQSDQLTLREVVWWTCLTLHHLYL